MEMTIEQAQAIRQEYAKWDDAFRAAKKDKRVPYAKVAEYKSKRDALEANVNEAIRFLRERGALS